VLSVKRLLLLIALAGFTACQPLPQPFQADSRAKAANVLARPVGETSLFITPVAGLPEARGKAMAEALATALADKDIPASALVRNRLSSILTVTMDDRGQWRWNERQHDGTELGEPARPLGTAPDRLDDPVARKQAAQAMATAIAARLNEALAAAMPAESAPARLAVQECTGAPGDGNRSLRQAMRELLILSGQPPVSEGADYIIGCEVKVWQDTASSERITIEWVLNAADGSRLGEVKQANRIPRGQLAQTWGNTAHIVAQGGWQGLSEIIESKRRGKPVLPPVKS
jgi:hypothetical protein